MSVSLRSVSIVHTLVCDDDTLKMLPSLYPVHENTGVLIDFNHDLSKGVNNDSLEQFVHSVQSLSTEHFVVVPRIINDYDQFVIDIEDDPRICEYLEGTHG